MGRRRPHHVWQFVGVRENCGGGPQIELERNYHDLKPNPRALRRTAHQSVERETFYGMHASVLCGVFRLS